jgi:ligand-binding sensor domain-containing protein
MAPVPPDRSRQQGTALAVVLTLFAVPHGHAEYLLRNWTTANGLPDNTVCAIVETRDGYLWMGTANGLVRFDGVRFTIFDPADTPGLPTADVYGLTKDPQDGLWLHSRRGVLRYHEGQFTPMPRPVDGVSGGLPTRPARRSPTSWAARSARSTRTDKT